MPIIYADFRLDYKLATLPYVLTEIDSLRALALSAGYRPLDGSFFSGPQTTRADRLVQGIGQNPQLPTDFGEIVATFGKKAPIFPPLY